MAGFRPLSKSWLFNFSLLDGRAGYGCARFDSFVLSPLLLRHFPGPCLVTLYPRQQRPLSRHVAPFCVPDPAKEFVRVFSYTKNTVNNTSGRDVTGIKVAYHVVNSEKYR